MIEHEDLDNHMYNFDHVGENVDINDEILDFFETLKVLIVIQGVNAIVARHRK